MENATKDVFVFLFKFFCFLLSGCVGLNFLLLINFGVYMSLNKILFQICIIQAGDFQFFCLSMSFKLNTIHGHWWGIFIGYGCVFSVLQSANPYGETLRHTPSLQRLDSTCTPCRLGSPSAPWERLSFLRALIRNECSLHRTPVALDSLIHTQTFLPKYSDYRGT